jgi:putative transposase
MGLKLMAGFKLYWTWISQRRVRAGQKMRQQGIARSHLLNGRGKYYLGRTAHPRRTKMLGFDLSERTVLRWMRRAPRNPEPAKRCAAFLSIHREAIAAMDFFTVPTLTFGVLYCFFVIAHDRRRILQCEVTSDPTSAWVIQQLREAFPYDSAPGYLVFDRGPQFNGEVTETVKSFGIGPKRTSFRSPWQNGIAEHWVGTCRRDLLDHVIVLNERHLKRLMNEYVRYYLEDRTHLALEKRTPAGREARETPGVGQEVTSMPRLCRLHHRCLNCCGRLPWSKWRMTAREARSVSRHSSLRRYFILVGSHRTADPSRKLLPKTPSIR